MNPTGIKKRHATPNEPEQEEIQRYQSTPKRPRTNATKSLSALNKKNEVTKATTTDINLIDDVFSIVMSMLAPREMIRMSLCSKSLMNMVAYGDVVRNTIMIGGHGRKSLRGVLELLRLGKIHFPSPLRLLRLTCGQRCEIPGCTNTVHTIRAQFGVFCCFPCIQNESLTQSIAFSGKELSEKFRFLMNHSRTARYESKRKITLWRKPFITASGERCGPLVTYDSIQEQLLQNQESNEDMTLLLDKNCNYESKLLESLLQMDGTATEKASSEERKERKERDARVQKYRRQKSEKLESTVEKIQALLDPRWKDLALKRQYFSNDGWTRYRELHETHEYNPRFNCQLIQHMKLIRDLIQAPSRHSSQKKIIKMADAIDKMFERIYENGFHDFSFLVNGEKKEDAFLFHLHKVITSVMPVERWLSNLRPEDLSLMEEHGPLLGLACKLEGEPMVYKPPTFFARAVVSYVNPRDKRYTDEAFARALWALKTSYYSNSSQQWTTSFRHNCQKTFQRTACAFTILRPQLLKYINHPDSIEFLKENTNGRSESWLKVKEEELNSVWVNTGILKCLLRGVEVDFESLRREHASKAESRWLGGYW